MALVAGDPSATTGLAKRIRDNLLAQMSTAIDNDELARLSYAIAKAVVDEIQANATVATVTACPAGAGTGTGTVT